jgi:hypothetical protein
VDNVWSDILRNVTFNPIYKAESLALSKCLSFQRRQLYMKDYLPYSCFVTELG